MNNPFKLLAYAVLGVFILVCVGCTLVLVFLIIQAVLNAQSIY